MISLIPCYSLEDFSLYRKASEVDEIFSAWSALYHPALVAHFGEAPRWEAAGSPSTGQQRRLVVVPPCAEYLVSRSWLKSAEAEGAVVIRHVSDRDAILAEAFHKLGISPTPVGSEPAAEPSSAPEAEDAAPKEYVYDDDAESFLAVGLCCLMEELLTRKLRYMSNLDMVSFKTRIVDASRAHMAGNAEEREKNIQKAFDLLTQSKEYFFPTATKFIDLTWARTEDLQSDLPAMLERRRLRKEQTNLVLPVPVLKACESQYPSTLRLIREEIEAKRLTILGGDEHEGPLYLESPLEIARQLTRGRAEYERLLGVAPKAFGRDEAGYAQILPQLLKQTGYVGALARTGDGWTLLEKKTDRSQIRWQGRDGSAVAAICKTPIDAGNSEDILQLPDKIGNSYYSDDASAVIFGHSPNQESRWLRDLQRMDRYSPVLGKFYEFNDYLHVTQGSGDTEKFVKDQFKTNFLTRSSKRSRENLVSLWPQRRRLGLALSELSTLETTLRTLTFKTRKTGAGKLDDAFQGYVDATASLKERINETLCQLDERLLPVDVDENLPAVDFTERLRDLEREHKVLLKKAGEFVALALETSDQKHDSDFPAQFADKRGFLLFNQTLAPQDVVWETRPAEGASSEKALAAASLLAETLGERLAATADGRMRSFSQDDSPVQRYCATLPSNASLWIPRLDELEYHFVSRSFLEAEENVPDYWEDGIKAPETAESAAPERRGSFLKKFASKLRGEVANSANQTTGNDGEQQQRRRQLAEYVELRYSATEIERYYALRNDILEIKVDPTTGSIKRLTTFNANAVFSNGMLRQPTLGNRFAWDVAFKLPEELRATDGRSDADPFYGYTILAADKITVVNSGPGVGRLRIEGRMVAPSGDLAGRYVQTLTLRLKSRVVDVDLEFEPTLQPGPGAWDSYYACRFAWKDSLADINGGVAASLIRTSRDYLQAPECVDIRSEEKFGITILSAGLPYFRKVSDTRMDAVLAPQGETRRHFRFGIGVDLADPHTQALAYADAEPIALEDVPCPRRITAQYLTVADSNVKILEAVPIIRKEEERKSDDRSVKRLNDDFVGVRVTMLETHSVETSTSLRSTLPVNRAQPVNLIGTATRETLTVKNGTTLALDFKPRQLRVVELYF